MEISTKVWERAVKILDQLWFNKILETSDFDKSIENLSKKVINERGKGAIPYVRKYIDIKLSKNPKKIISGGQTGADQGGLEAARYLGIITSGTIPKDFLTENGSDYSLQKFHLNEHNSSNYVPRTIDNIKNSCGTVAFLIKKSIGTGKTIGYCQKKKWVYYSDPKTKLDGYRPVLVITNLEDIQVNSLCLKGFVENNKIEILNVAGHRESSLPGIQEKVKQTIINAFL